MDTEKTDVKDWNGAELWIAELVQQAKTNAKRWFIAWIITLIALVGTNMAWLYVFQSYDYVNQDGTGINSINTGHQEDIQYHVTEGKDEEKSQEE